MYELTKAKMVFIISECRISHFYKYSEKLYFVIIIFLYFMIIDK